jgi:hypothetical protein
MKPDPLQRQQALLNYQMGSHPSPYAQLYGLKDYPFPLLALFSATSPDPRRNGTIYDSEFRKSEEERFFRLFVQPVNGDEAVHLGFIRLDPQAGGRGTGKSCFLHRLMERVNSQDWRDWPTTPDDPQLNSLAVYLLPEPRKQRQFWQLARLVFEAMAEQDLLSCVDVELRAAMFFKLVPYEARSALLRDHQQEASDSLKEPVRFLALMQKAGITAENFNAAVDAELRRIGDEVPDNGFRDVFVKADCSLVKLWRDWSDDYTATSDYTWRKSGVSWLVNGLVPILILANYRRFILLVDEFEKIYSSQTGREREDFLDALRQHFYERDSVASRLSFITTVLTIHPSMDVYLSKEWSRVGLDNIAPLSPDRLDQIAVKLGHSDSESLKHLIITYLDYYRVDGDKNKGKLYPFSEDAFQPVFSAARFYPRGVLWYAHQIIGKALKEGVAPLITQDYVKRFIETSEKPPLEDVEPDYGLPKAETDLKK